MKICVILGGAVTVWRELHHAEKLLEQRSYIVGAVNDTGVVYPGQLGFWATLHPAKMAVWRDARRHLAGDDGGVGFAHCGGVGGGIHRIVPRWPGPSGSSGLYATQIALDVYAADRVILCGVPLDSRPNLHRHESAWRQAAEYRAGWVRAMAHDLVRGRVRSMSGWTREMLGYPSADWLGAGA